MACEMLLASRAAVALAANSSKGAALAPIAQIVAIAHTITRVTTFIAGRSTGTITPCGRGWVRPCGDSTQGFADRPQWTAKCFCPLAKRSSCVDFQALQ